MISGWCPPADGIHSGARMTSGWCRRLWTLLWVACVTGKGESEEHGSQVTTAFQMSGFVRGEDEKLLVACDIHSGGTITRDWCPKPLSLVWAAGTEGSQVAVHTGCQYSSVSEDDKRLEPTGHRMSARALE